MEKVLYSAVDSQQVGAPSAEEQEQQRQLHLSTLAEVKAWPYVQKVEAWKVVRDSLQDSNLAPLASGILRRHLDVGRPHKLSDSEVIRAAMSEHLEVVRRCESTSEQHKAKYLQIMKTRADEAIRQAALEDLRRIGGKAAGSVSPKKACTTKAALQAIRDRQVPVAQETVW